jgi:hypothetical protein
VLRVGFKAAGAVAGRGRFLAAAAVFLVAGCGDSGGTLLSADRPQITVHQANTAQAGGTLSPGTGQNGPQPGAAGPSKPGAPASAPSQAQPGPVSGTVGAAAPGSYPMTVTSERSGGPPSAPRGASSSQGTLNVNPATAAPGGMAQSSVITGEGGFQITQDVLFPAGGGVQLTRTQSSASSFCPPFELDPRPSIEVLPPQLLAGAAWGPSPFTSPGINGSVSGAVGGRSTDTIGGVSVGVWSARLTIDIQDGTYCGYRFSGTIEQTGDWAPSLNLFVSGKIQSNLTFSAFGQISSTTTYQLLSTRPG